MYLNIMYKNKNFIRIGKQSIEGRAVNFNEINLNEWNIYKSCRSFKILNYDEIINWSQSLLIHKDYDHYTDEFIRWVEINDLNVFVYLNHPITFNPWDIKIIEESV